MGVFDQSARFAAQKESKAFFRRLCQDFPILLQFRDWIDSRTSPLPGDRDLTADRVAVFSQQNQPDSLWVIVQEFQAQEDFDKLDTTLAEVARLRIELRHGSERNQKYAILSALIYLKGQCPITELDMTGGSKYGTYHVPLI